jgi:hypothetical protein
MCIDRGAGEPTFAQLFLNRWMTATQIYLPADLSRPRLDYRDRVAILEIRLTELTPPRRCQRSSSGCLAVM